MKILTFTIQRAIHTTKEDNSKFIFFFRIMLLFWLFILYHAPHSGALAPVCGALVLFFYFAQLLELLMPYAEDKETFFV